MCTAGYTGDKCNGCATGYTQDASGKCSRDPESKTVQCRCDNGTPADDCTITSEVKCTLCTAGYTGDKCDACATGYTQDASGKCSRDPESKTVKCRCDNGTPAEDCTIAREVKCTSCNPGYVGDTCTKCDGNNYVKDGLCQKCPANSICADGQIQKSCRPTEMVQDGACRPIPVDYYKSMSLPDDSEAACALSNAAEVSDGCRLLLHSYTSGRTTALVEGNYTPDQVEQLLDGQSVHSVELEGNAGCAASFNGQAWRAGDHTDRTQYVDSPQITTQDAARELCEQQHDSRLCSVKEVMQSPALGCKHMGWVTDGMEEAWVATGCPNPWKTLAQQPNGKAALSHWYAMDSPQAVYADMYSMCTTALSGKKDGMSLLAKEMCCGDNPDCQPQCILAQDFLQSTPGYASDGTVPDCPHYSMDHAWMTQAPSFAEGTVGDGRELSGVCHARKDLPLDSATPNRPVPDRYSAELQMAPPCSLMTSANACTGEHCTWTAIDTVDACRRVVERDPGLAGFEFRNRRCTVYEPGSSTTLADGVKQLQSAGAYCCRDGLPVERGSHSLQQLIGRTACAPAGAGVPVANPHTLSPLKLATSVCQQALDCSRTITQRECANNAACTWRTENDQVNPCPASHPYKVQRQVQRPGEPAPEDKSLEERQWWCSAVSGVCGGTPNDVGTSCASRKSPWSCVSDSGCTWSTAVNDVPTADLCRYTGNSIANSDQLEEVWGMNPEVEACIPHMPCPAEFPYLTVLPEAGNQWVCSRTPSTSESRDCCSQRTKKMRSTAWSELLQDVFSNTLNSSNAKGHFDTWKAANPQYMVRPLPPPPRAGRGHLADVEAWKTALASLDANKVDPYTSMYEYCRNQSTTAANCMLQQTGLEPWLLPIGGTTTFHCDKTCSQSGRCSSLTAAACGVNPPVPGWRVLKNVNITDPAPLGTSAPFDAGMPDMPTSFLSWRNSAAHLENDSVTACKEQCLTTPGCATISIASTGRGSKATCTFHTRGPLQSYGKSRLAGQDTDTLDLVACDVKPPSPQFAIEGQPAFACLAVAPGMGPFCEAFQTEASCTALSTQNDTGPGPRPCAWRPVGRQRTSYALPLDHWGQPFTEYEYSANINCQQNPTATACKAVSAASCKKACMDQNDCVAWSFYPGDGTSGSNFCRTRTSLYGQNPRNKGFTAYTGSGLQPTSGEIRATVTHGAAGDHGATVLSSADSAKQLCQRRFGSSRLCSPVDLLAGGESSCSSGWVAGAVPEDCVDNAGQLTGTLTRDPATGCVICTPKSGAQCRVPLNTCIDQTKTLPWCNMTTLAASTGHASTLDCAKVSDPGDLTFHTDDQASGAYCCPEALPDSFMTDRPMAVRYSKYHNDQLQQELTRLGCSAATTFSTRLATCSPLNIQGLEDSTYLCGGFTSAWVRPYTDSPTTSAEVATGKACSPPPALPGNLWRPSVIQDQLNNTGKVVNMAHSYTCKTKPNYMNTLEAGTEGNVQGSMFCQTRSQRNASGLQQQLLARNSPDNAPHCCAYNQNTQSYQWQDGSCGDASGHLEWKANYLRVGKHSTPSLCQQAVSLVGQCRATSRSATMCSGKTQEECPKDGCAWEQTPTGYLWFEDGPDKHECRALLSEPSLLAVSPPSASHVKGVLHSGQRLLQQWRNMEDEERRQSMQALLPSELKPALNSVHSDNSSVAVDNDGLTPQGTTGLTLYIDEQALTQAQFCGKLQATQAPVPLNYCPDGFTLQESNYAYTAYPFVERTEYQFPLPGTCSPSPTLLTTTMQQQGQAAAMQIIRDQCSTTSPPACAAWSTAQAAWRGRAEAEAYCLAWAATGQDRNPTVKTPDGLYQCTTGCPPGSSIAKDATTGHLYCQLPEGGGMCTPQHMARNLHSASAALEPVHPANNPQLGPTQRPTSVPVSAAVACQESCADGCSSWYYDGTTCNTASPALVYQGSSMALGPASGWGGQKWSYPSCFQRHKQNRQACNADPACTFASTYCTNTVECGEGCRWSIPDASMPPCPVLTNFTPLPLLPTDLQQNPLSPFACQGGPSCQALKEESACLAQADCRWTTADQDSWAQQLVTASTPLTSGQQATELCQAQGYDGLCTTAQVRSLNFRPDPNLPPKFSGQGFKTLDNAHRGGWAVEGTSPQVVTLGLQLPSVSSPTTPWPRSVGICTGSAGDMCLAASTQDACHLTPGCQWMSLNYLQSFSHIPKGQGALLPACRTPPDPTSDTLCSYAEAPKSRKNVRPIPATLKPVAAEWKSTPFPATETVTPSPFAGSTYTLAPSLATLLYKAGPAQQAYCCRSSTTVPPHSIRGMCPQTPCPQKAVPTGNMFPLATSMTLVDGKSSSSQSLYNVDLCLGSTPTTPAGNITALQYHFHDTPLFDSKAIRAQSALTAAGCPNTSPMLRGLTLQHTNQQLKQDCLDADLYLQQTAACKEADQEDACNALPACAWDAAAGCRISSAYRTSPPQNTCLGGYQPPGIDNPCANASASTCTSRPLSYQCMWETDSTGQGSCIQNTNPCAGASREACLALPMCGFSTPPPGRRCQPDSSWTLSGQSFRRSIGTDDPGALMTSCNAQLGCSASIDYDSNAVQCNAYTCSAVDKKLACNQIEAVQVTRDQCQTMCTQSTGCTGYIYDRERCWGVADPPEFSDSSPSTASYYSQVPTQTMLAPGWQRLESQDCRNAPLLLTLPTSTQDERQRLCASMPDCIGFNTLGQLWGYSPPEEERQAPQAICQILPDPSRTLFLKAHTCRQNSTTCTANGTCCSARLDHETHVEKDCQTIKACADDHQVEVYATETLQSSCAVPGTELMQQASLCTERPLQYFRSPAMQQDAAAPCPNDTYAIPAAWGRPASCAPVQPGTEDSSEMQMVEPSRADWNPPGMFCAQQDASTCSGGCQSDSSRGCHSPQYNANPAVYRDAPRGISWTNQSCAKYLPALPRAELGNLSLSKWTSVLELPEEVQLAEWCGPQEDVFSYGDLHQLYNSTTYNYFNPMFPCVKTNGNENHPIAVEMATWQDIAPDGVCPQCCTGTGKRQSSPECPCAVLTNAVMDHHKVSNPKTGQLPTTSNLEQSSTLVRMSTDIPSSCDRSLDTFENLQWGGKSCSQRCDLVGAGNEANAFTAMYTRNDDGTLSATKPKTAPFHGAQYLAQPDLPEAKRMCRPLSMAALTAVATPVPGNGQSTSIYGSKYKASDNSTPYQILRKNINQGHFNSYVWLQDTPEESNKWNVSNYKTTQTHNTFLSVSAISEHDPTVLHDMGCQPRENATTEQADTCYTATTWADCPSETCTWRGGCVGGNLRGTDASNRCNTQCLPCGALNTRKACEGSDQDPTGCSWLGPSIRYQRALSDPYVNALLGLDHQCKYPLVQKYDRDNNRHYCHSTCLPETCTAARASDPVQDSCPLLRRSTTPSTACTLLGDQCSTDALCTTTATAAPICMLPTRTVSERIGDQNLQPNGTCPAGYLLTTEEDGSRKCQPVRDCLPSEMEPVQSHATSQQQNSICTNLLLDGYHNQAPPSTVVTPKPGSSDNSSAQCSMYNVYLAQPPQLCSDFTTEVACNLYPACSWDNERGKCASRNAWEANMYASDSQWCPLPHGWNKSTQQCTGCEVDYTCPTLTSESECTAKKKNKQSVCAWNAKTNTCTFRQQYFDREWTSAPSGTATAPTGCRPVTACKPGEYVVHPATQISDNICAVIEDNICIPNYVGMTTADATPLPFKGPGLGATCAGYTTKQACNSVPGHVCRWAESDAILAGVVTGKTGPACDVSWVQQQCGMVPHDKCGIEGSVNGFDPGYWCGETPVGSGSTGCSTKPPSSVCALLNGSQGCKWATTSPGSVFSCSKPPTDTNTKPPASENPPVFLWGESRLQTCPPAQVMVRKALVCADLTEDECKSSRYKDRCKLSSDSGTYSCQSRYNTAHCSYKSGTDGHAAGGSTCPKGPGYTASSGYAPRPGNYYIENSVCTDLHEYCIARLDEDKNYSLVNRASQIKYALPQTSSGQFPLSNCLHNDTAQSLGLTLEGSTPPPKTRWLAPFQKDSSTYMYMDTAQFLQDNLLDLAATDKPALLTKYSNLAFTTQYALPSDITFGSGPACGVVSDGLSPEGTETAPCMHNSPKDRCMYRFSDPEKAAAACLYYNHKQPDIRSSFEHLPPLPDSHECKGVVELPEAMFTGEHTALPTVSTNSLEEALRRSTYCMDYAKFKPVSSTLAPMEAGFPDTISIPLSTTTTTESGMHGYMSAQTGTAGPLKHVPEYVKPEGDLHPFGNNMMPMGQTWIGRNALGMMANDKDNRIHFVTRGDCLGQDPTPQLGKGDLSWCNQPSPYRGNIQWEVSSPGGQTRLTSDSDIGGNCDDLADETNNLIPAKAQNPTWANTDDRRPSAIANSSPIWGGDDGDDYMNARAHGSPDDAGFNNDDSTALYSCRANHNAWGRPERITPEVWSALGNSEDCKKKGENAPRNLYGYRAESGQTPAPQTCAYATWQTPAPGHVMDVFAQTTGFDIAFFNVFKGQTAKNEYQYDIHNISNADSWGWGGGAGERSLSNMPAAWLGIVKSDYAVGDEESKINNTTWIAKAETNPALARPQGNLTLGMYGAECNDFLYGLGMGGPTYNLAPATGPDSLPKGEWGLPELPPDMLAPYAWWSGNNDTLREKMWMHLPVMNGAVGSSQRQMRGNPGRAGSSSDDMIWGDQSLALGYINSNTFYHSAGSLLELPEELPEEPEVLPEVLLADQQADALKCATVHKSHLFGDDITQFSNNMATAGLAYTKYNDDGDALPMPTLNGVGDAIRVRWLSSQGISNNHGAQMQNLNMWSSGVGTTHSREITRPSREAFTMKTTGGELPPDFKPLPHVLHLPLDYAVRPRPGATDTKLTVASGNKGVYTASSGATADALPAQHMRAELCVQGQQTCQPVVVDTTHNTMKPAEGATLPPVDPTKQTFLNYAAPSVAYPGDGNTQMYIMPSGPMLQGSAGWTSSGNNTWSSAAAGHPSHENDPVAVFPWFDMTVGIKNAQERFTKAHWGTTKWNESLVTAAKPYRYQLVTGPRHSVKTAISGISNTTTYAKKYMPAWLPGQCIGSSATCATHKEQETCTGEEQCTWIDYTYMTSPEPRTSDRAQYTDAQTDVGVAVTSDPFMWTLNKAGKNIAPKGVVNGGRLCTNKGDKWFDCSTICQTNGTTTTSGESGSRPFRLNGIPLCATMDVLEATAGPVQVRKLPGLYNTPAEGTSACQVGAKNGPELCTDQQLLTYLSGSGSMPTPTALPSPASPVWTGNGHHFFTQSDTTQKWQVADMGKAVADAQANAASAAGGNPMPMTLPSQVYCCSYS